MPSSEKRTARLLAIDDSTLIHRLLKVRLKTERIETHHAYTGEQGLSLASELMPDVILLDISLPDINGFEVLHALKADPMTHDIPVIFISGSTDTEKKVLGLEMGAIDFVTKPFELAELRARVRSALRLRLLIKMLAERAQLDALTGLWNRAYFDERMSQEVNQAERYETPLSLIFTDLDHFKSLNDEYGHTFGDLVLESFAGVLTQGRTADIACRYGGEEFVIIVPHAGAEDAASIAERYREAIRELRWDGHPEVRVTASFGVSDTEIAGCDAQALIESADDALYKAKEAGRDCVKIATTAQGGTAELRRSA